MCKMLSRPKEELMVTSFVHRPLSLVEATPVAQPAGLVVNPGIQPGTLGCGIDPFIQP
jgi:hypothetical protein